MIADVRDLRTIRRPDCVPLSEPCVAGQLVELARRDVVEVDQLGPGIGGEIPFDVLFEMIAVNDNRLWLLFVTCILLFVFGFLFGIFGYDEQQLLRIG